MIYKICDVMMSISTWDRVHFWIYLLNHNSWTLKKTLWPLFMDGVQLPRLEPLRGGSLFFNTKFPEIPGTYFIDLGRTKGWVDLGSTQWFWTWDLGLGIQRLNHGASLCHITKKKFIQKFYKICDLTTSSRPFCVCKELSTISIGKWNFWSILVILDM